MDTKDIKTIDEYIAGFPADVQAKLQEMRRVIKEEAPDAVEAMAYGMPTFRLNGNLVHFAAFQKHMGFYPTPTGIDEFKADLEPYQTSKGAVQFPLDKPLPFDLMRRMVRFRVKEALEKDARGKKK